MSEQKGILRRIFAKSSGAAKLQSENSDLRMQVKQLRSGNQKLKQRLQLELENSKAVRAQLKAHKEVGRIEEMRLRSVKLRERIESYAKTDNFILPRADLEDFIQKCRTGNPEMAEQFLTALEEDNFIPLFEQLYAQEMSTAQTFNFENLYPAISFLRGYTDISYAERRGLAMENLKSSLLEKQSQRMDTLLALAFRKNDRVKSVCEIGAAWGGTTNYLVNRFKPITYHSYEIDSGWAEWLESKFAITSMPCDGESLSSTDDESMDLCVAMSCLYFMPFMKQWSYLTEMARVLKPGGSAIINLLPVENLQTRHLKALFKQHFPKRAFGYVPTHCIATAFPDNQFEQLIDDPKSHDNTYIFRKLQ